SSAVKCSGIHLESANGLKGLTEVRHRRFAPPGRPAQGENIETGGAVEQPVRLQKEQGKLSQLLLFGVVNRRSGPFDVVPLGRTHLDEDHAGTFQRDKVEFAVWAGVIAGEDAIAETAKVTSGRPLGAAAKPPPPPGNDRRAACHARPPPTNSCEVFLPWA